ncbi:hypothetical protein C8Q72DRAFT_251877, partial [Fomitopsis betulina]
EKARFPVRSRAGVGFPVPVQKCAENAGKCFPNLDLLPHEKRVTKARRSSVVQIDVRNVPYNGGGYREDWATPIGIRAVSGNAPRHRIESGARVEEGIAPPCLWHNCYDQEWLQSLKPHVLKSLHIIDDNYDFSLKSANPA